MPKKRKKSSAYTILVALSFGLVIYLYYTTNNLVVFLLLVLLGVGIALPIARK
jgi:hypothetical protein